MKWDESACNGWGGYILSSGKEFSANLGLISCKDPESAAFSINEGYDGGVYYDYEGHDNISGLSKADLIEIADFMIDRWAKVKVRYSK